MDFPKEPKPHYEIIRAIIHDLDKRCENGTRMAKTKVPLVASNGTPDPRWRENLANRVIGQKDSIDAIIPFIDVYFAGLNPPDRPVGIFLLLGSTGSGKTHTAEALAGALHGNIKQLLRIDCGSYQSDHEISKLIGSPPGYLGHRETKPLISSEKLAVLRSDKCGLAILVFDEIEKGSEALKRLLLAMMDKGELQTGENTIVKLENTLLILTSNLGSHDIRKALRGSFSFGDEQTRGVYSKALIVNQAKKHFSAEFINRLDEILPYNVLSQTDILVIVDRIFLDIVKMLDAKLGTSSPNIHLTISAKKWFAERGFDPEYGARSLKRLMTKEIQHPLALAISTGEIGPSDDVWLKANKNGVIEFSVSEAVAS